MSQCFYAVGAGRQVGVYSTWAECQKQVVNFSNAKYKKFKTHTEAVEFIQQCYENNSPSKSLPESQFRKDTINLPCASASYQQYSSTSLTKSSGRHEIIPARKVASNSGEHVTSLLTLNKSNVAEPSQPQQRKRKIQERQSSQTLLTIQKYTKENWSEIENNTQKTATVESNNDTEVAAYNMIFERVDKYFADIKNFVNHISSKLDGLGNIVKEASSENTPRKESMEIECNDVSKLNSSSLSPQTLSEIQNWEEDDILISGSSETNSQCHATMGSNNDTGVAGLNGLFEMVDSHFIVIKNTFDHVISKINDLENKIEKPSCRYITENCNTDVGVLNNAGSRVKRLLLESCNVPRPTGNRSKTEFNEDIIPGPPEKRLKIEPHFNHKFNDVTHDFIVNKDGFVIVYTDGACENNGKRGAKAGIGVWFGDGHPLNCSKPVDGRPTNNTAEIQAAVQALEIAKRAGVKNIVVHTDSEFTINCITKWVRKWVKNDWKVASGGNVKNKDDLILLLKAMEGMDVKWEHVRGHQGIHGNEMADRLARNGALQYKLKRKYSNRL